jgi:hypothetical protein
VSPELRARLWAIFHQNLINAGGDGELSGPFAQVLYDLHVQRFCRAADEFSPFGYAWVSQFKPVFMDGNYIQIFGLVQWVLRHPTVQPYGVLPTGVDEALRASRAAYALFDRDTIIPVGSDTERETLARAFADVAASEFHGARAHLRNAGSELTAGNYAASIRESIHAVEAVARVLEPGAQTLGPAPLSGRGSAAFTGSPVTKKVSATRCWTSQWHKWTRRTRSTCSVPARHSSPT